MFRPSSWLPLLVLALLVAVASLTAVGFFTSRIGLAVERQAGEVLAADLRLGSARPISAAYDAEAAKRGFTLKRIRDPESLSANRAHGTAARREFAPYSPR